MRSVSFEKLPWGSDLVGKSLRNWFQMAFHGELSTHGECLLSKAVFSQARIKSWLCLHMDFIPAQRRRTQSASPQVPVQEELGQKSVTQF